MDSQWLQSQCAPGQQQLMEMRYLEAERTLAKAEAFAWAQRDFDALSRLYMPLQESRRQRRQRCGEGAIRVDLLSRGAGQPLDAAIIIEQIPQGQLLLAGWGSIQPALELRALQELRGLYLETFLAAAYPLEGGLGVAILPEATAKLPPPSLMSRDELTTRLPPHSLVLLEKEIPPPTYGDIMSLWERLHKPFLAQAIAQTEPIRKMEGFRRTISVDYACELAHQMLADAARAQCRSRA